jgi:hypothetical protein
MKLLGILIIVMYLLMPLACFAHPCESCLDAVSDISDTSGVPGSHSHSHDADNCDSTFCCAECTHLQHEIPVVYSPRVTVLEIFERYQHFPTVVIPIFIPPQNLV